MDKIEEEKFAIQKIKAILSSNKKRDILKSILNMGYDENISNEEHVSINYFDKNVLINHFKFNMDKEKRITKVFLDNGDDIELAPGEISQIMINKNGELINDGSGSVNMELINGKFKEMDKFSQMMSDDKCFTRRC